MRRIDRAIRIRDAILARPTEEWSWHQASGQRFRILSRSRWSAMLATPFTSVNPDPPVSSYSQAVLLASRLRPLRYHLSLWVKGMGKVLALEWGSDNARLISMRPGAWQDDLFAT